MGCSLSLWLAALLFIAGVVFLVKGADWLVEHSAILAEGLGVPHIVVGLTVVAFGTSAPELAAGIGASIRDVGELALGTVIGSNIANIALILGVSSFIAPLACPRTIAVKEMPLMLLAMGVGWATFVGGSIGRLEGAVLFTLVVMYTWHTYRASKREPAVYEHPVPDEEELEAELAAPRGRRWWIRHGLMVGVGIVGLTAGAEMLVRSTVELAERMGVSEVVIGLTMVALGTSLPELATAIRAAMKRHTEILLGNVIGSNVFNTLCVLGATAMVRPIPVPRSSIAIDAPVMMGVAVLAWIMASARRRLSWWEGAVLLTVYAVYVGYVLLTTQSG